MTNDSEKGKNKKKKPTDVEMRRLGFESRFLSSKLSDLGQII